MMNIPYNLIQDKPNPVYEEYILQYHTRQTYLSCLFGEYTLQCYTRQP